MLTVLILVLDVVVKSAEYLNKRERGFSIGQDIATIVAGWENSMDYYCASGSAPISLALSDLGLPSSYISNNYAAYTFNYTPPPNTSIAISIDGPEVSLNKAASSLPMLLQEQETSASVNSRVLGSRFEVVARRTSLTSQSVFDIKRGNSNASITSIMIDGTGVFDSNGCQ